jgi:hypothetical protein
VANAATTFWLVSYAVKSSIAAGARPPWHEKQ